MIGLLILFHLFFFQNLIDFDGFKWYLAVQGNWWLEKQAGVCIIGSVFNANAILFDAIFLSIKYCN